MFVFLNRRKNQVKLIVWTRGGFTIVHKRLEAGTFAFPAQVVDGVASVVIDVHELAMLLEGIEVTQIKTKPRWEPTAARSRNGGHGQQMSICRLTGRRVLTLGHIPPSYIFAYIFIVILSGVDIRACYVQASQDRSVAYLVV